MKFYGAIALLLILAGLGTTIFVQKHMIETTELKQKTAEDERDYWKNTAADRKRRASELTKSLTEREHELQRSRAAAETHRRRADALAGDECLDRSVSPDLDRLLRDAFPASETGEGGDASVDRAPAPGVDGQDEP